MLDADSFSSGTDINNTIKKTVFFIVYFAKNANTLCLPNVLL